MSERRLKSLAKEVLGQVPISAELYQAWVAQETHPQGGYSLERLTERLPVWVRAAEAARSETQLDRPRRILIFAYLKWWLEHASALALLLHAEGHDVSLAYLPYRRWAEKLARFDVRRQSTHLARAVEPMASAITLHDLSRAGRPSLPPGLEAELDRQTLLDVQYTLQREDVNTEADIEARALFELRHERNWQAAAAAARALKRRAYDTVIIPNGSILEFGAVYRTARNLGVRAVTYEFGEQRERLWLAQDAEVMRLPTDGMWSAVAEIPLTRTERDRIESLYAARRKGRPWSQFARRWQRGESAGAAEARARLGLADDSPMILLCTNVVGDSLALDRQVFTEGMADWLARTVRLFAERLDCQLVVRVHPGELLGAGHASADIVAAALPDLPASIKLVPPDSSINTYDLIELAHLGVVYTTTVGMEMAMLGVPVVTAGQTHYRGKGFTEDPATFADYKQAIDRRLQEPPGRMLEPEQIDLAWRYAYRFFFDYPFSFPWHLLSFWEDVADRPVEAMVQPDAREAYALTLAALSGASAGWTMQSARESAVEGVG